MSSLTRTQVLPTVHRPPASPSSFRRTPSFFSQNIDQPRPKKHTMITFTTFARSLGRQYLSKKLRPHDNLSQQLEVSQKLIFPQKPSFNNGCYQYQSHRALILESLPSESVKLQKHSDSDSGIFEVSLDRPNAKNAIGREMLDGLRRAFETIDKDASAKVVMISSSVPKVFCAGADLKERMAMAASEIRSFVNTLRSTFSFIESLCIPTIAVIEGAALGGGLEMALSCDLRVCGEDAVLGLPETGLAIIPGAGGTQRLPRLVGKSVAKELIFTGRKIGGQEAMSLGLVNYSVAAGEAHLKALEIAREINLKGPIAIKMAKKAIYKGPEMDMASALELEEECYEQTLYTRDRLEGLAAFAEKRKPTYKGE